MTDIPTVQKILDDALSAYRSANERLTLASLYLMAAKVREDYPEASTITAEWSDQGPYLSGLLTVDEGLPGEDEDYDQEDTYAYNFDEGSESVWTPFTTSEDGTHYVFDLERIITEVGPLLDAAEDSP